MSKKTATVSASEVSVESSFGIRDKFQQLFMNLSTQFYERSEVIEGLIVGLLSGRHVALLGDPGTGKTALTETFASAFDVSFFQHLMNRFTTPEDLYGPVKLSGLKEDKYERQIEGMMPTATIVYLDEVFKASGTILNANLAMLNERVFYNGGKKIYCPLRFLVGSSNELPEEGASLEALWDRFTLRYWVEPIQSPEAKADLMLRVAEGWRPEPGVIFSEEELAAAIGQVDEMPFERTAAQAFILLEQALAEKGIKISDRRRNQCVQLLKATAWFRGDDAVFEDHFTILRHVLWSEMEQQEEITKAIRRIGGAVTLKIKEAVKAAEEIVKAIPSIASFSDSVEWLRDIQSKLKALKAQKDTLEEIASSTTAKRADKAAEAALKIGAMIEQIQLEAQKAVFDRT